MYVLYQTLSQLTQAAFVYVFLIFGYSQVSDAASCGDFGTAYLALSAGAPNNTAFTIFNRSTTANAENCNQFIMSGLEYENLVKNRIDTAAINISAIQANQTTLHGNIQTVNASLQTVADMASQSKTDIEEMKAFLQTHSLRDADNLLHVSHDDALLLFYAVMGLFATAFVGRYIRNSLHVSETYTAAE